MRTFLKRVVLGWAISFILVAADPVLACPDGQHSEGPCPLCLCVPSLPDPGGDISDFIKNAARELQMAPEAVLNCTKNVPQCTQTVIAAPVAQFAQVYIDQLYKQTNGRVRPFSPEFIALVRPYYDIDFNGLTYADGVNTGTGMSLAYCDRIFFITTESPWDSKDELQHTLHEFEHLVQCQKRGRQVFLAEYILKAGADVLRTGRVNVHDIHDFEVAADGKAGGLVEILWGKIQRGEVAVPPLQAGALPSAPGPVAGSMSPIPNTSSGAYLCGQNEVYMPTQGGACCTPDYRICRNKTTGVVTCGMFGC